MTDGWHPDATILHGPDRKTGYVNIPQRDGRGAILHSMEGSMAAGLNVLQGSRPVSWHFSVPKEGEGFYQHYSIERITWHGGGPGANRRFFGVEHEGVAGEPLTEHQIDCDVAILTWAMENDVLPWPGFIRHDTLWEHREMTRFGSSPTACPSGRIPWEEEIDMSMLFERMLARLAAVETGNAWQQGAIDQYKQDIADIQTVNKMQQGALDNHEERIKKLETDGA